MRAVSNPPNPWESTHAEWIGEPPAAKLEVFEEDARSIVTENTSPDVPMRFSVNPYRGCFHACAYCLGADTPILMASGRTKPISDVRVGDHVIGTVPSGRYRRYAKTPILHHWSRNQTAYRVLLEDGTELIASGDHRFLTERGWKHVAGRGSGRDRRPHLTTNNHLLGTGRFAPQPSETPEYRRGYLCGIIRGDGLLGSWSYDGRRRDRDTVHQFRLALVDLEALARARRYLAECEIETREFTFAAANRFRRQMLGIRTNARAAVDRVRDLVRWPSDASSDWSKGFLAGIFDAEGSYGRGILRICNTDLRIIERIRTALSLFRFDSIVETRSQENPLYIVRVRRGLREHLRFFHTCDPAITRKRTIEGQAIKNDSGLRVVSVEPLGGERRLFDITTGTGDFIANGVVSHNCYARSSHEYLGFGAGTDFERKIVVKVNAPERLREHFEKPSWKGDWIAFSGNTDCYQPLEACYRLTRRCLEVCLESANPVGLITKSALIRRDIELLYALSRVADASVCLSICFSDDAMSRAIEPNTSPPSQRFQTLKILSDAGIRTAVGIAPVIPGLNDSQIPEILERARRAGASSAFLLPIRLSGRTLDVFRERLAEAYPARLTKIWNAIREIRGGALNDTRFGYRLRGEGPRWAAIEALFEVQCRGLGFSEERTEGRSGQFHRPSPQKPLFD